MLNRRNFVILAAAATAGATATRAAGADAPIKLRVAEVARSHFYAPMYVALSRGYARGQGLDVELISANGGDKAGALILSGGTDIALAGPEVPIYIYNGESPDKPAIFCALTGTDGFFLVSRKPIGQFTWDMLNGQKILGYRPGSTPELYLEYVLKMHDVAPGTIKSVITNLSPQTRVGAWLSGMADFGTFLEPDLTQIERAGMAHVVASIGKEVGRADYTTFFAMRPWLAANGPAAQRWTNAITQAQNWMKTATPADIGAAIAPYFPGLPLADSISAVDRIAHSGAVIWANSPLVDPKGLAKLEEIMVSGGTLPAAKLVPYDRLVEPQFANAAMANAG